MSAFTLYAPSSDTNSSIDPAPSSDGSEGRQSTTVTAYCQPSSSQRHRALRSYPTMSECDQSIAAASALVGETLLDSPTSQRMTKRFQDDKDDNLGVSRHVYSEDRIHQLIDAANVGVIASGWAWVKSQRARRQREYLQHQAEIQLRKIAEAQETETTVAAAVKPRSLDQNPTFQQLTRNSREDIPSLENDNSHRSSNGQDDAAAAAADTNNNAGVKVTSARISKSGLGISVSVEVPSEWEHPQEDAENGGVWVPDVRVVDEEENLLSYPFILTHAQMQDIASRVLPLGISHCLWKRLYSLARDGDSFEACLRLVGSEPRSLLVLRTTRGAVFGGFADSPWEITNQQVSGFHGSAQACLFTFHSSSNNGGGRSPLVVYKWTGANRYFQLLSPERKMLAFGGGGDDGSFGLCVEQDFQLGSTGCCDTFGNQPLCDQESFSIVDMEIWSFVTGRF